MPNSNNSGGGDNSRRRLFERFKDNIGRPDTDFFDEDDLIDIYDYADDIRDEFVKMEVLFYGARMFPDSEALKIRRDYLYYYLGNDEAVKIMLDRRKSDTFLSQLLALRAQSDSRKSTADALDSLLTSLDHKLDDEEVIRLVDEASTDENYPWLTANIERIKELSEYPVTLLYEVASVARDRADFSLAVKLADELTMLEPFNTEFWELLADTHLLNQNIKEALISVEYALALNPKSAPARLIKGLALFHNDNSSIEAARLLAALGKENELDVDGVKALAIVLINNQHTEDALLALETFLHTHPDEINALDLTMLINPECSRNILSHIDTSKFPDNETFWVEWASRHSIRNNHLSAAEILNVALKCGILKDHLWVLFEEYYRASQYERVIELQHKLADSPMARRPEVFLASIMSLVRLGMREQALLLTRNIAESGIACLTPGDADQSASYARTRLINEGIKTTLSGIIKALSANDNTLQADAFDPFIL